VRAVTLFRSGGALVLAVGCLHFLGRFAPPPDSPAFALAREAMQAFSLRIFGIETNLHAIHELLDWSFTLYSLLVGALDLVAARALAAQPGALRAVSLVNAAGLAALIAVAVHYRVAPPGVFFALALAAFAGAAVQARA
jgi:hypothetical protein